MPSDDDIAGVRLLVADTDVDNPVYNDDQYTRFLGMESGHVDRAAARALETYAVHLAQVSGVVRGLLDIQVGGDQAAGILLRRADQLRAGTAGTTAGGRYGTVFPRAGLVGQGRNPLR